MRLLAICMVFLASQMNAQDVFEITYTIDCPADWQDSLMALRTEPPMLVYCSAGHTVVKTNLPFHQTFDARIGESNSWSERTSYGQWLRYNGEILDSSLVSKTIVTTGKAKKSDPILNYPTFRTIGDAKGLSGKKIEVYYTDKLNGVHSWCPGLKGMPLKFVIPTDMGDFVLTAKTIEIKTPADLPAGPTGQREVTSGDELKNSIFYDEDSTYVTVFGMITDTDNNNVLSLTEIKVFEKDKEIMKLQADHFGSYNFRLKAGSVYVLEFGTAPYVVKRIQLDLLAMGPRSPLLMVNLDGDLFQNPKNIDCSVLKAPVLKMYYDMNAKDMAFDATYNESRKAMLNELMQKLK